MRWKIDENRRRIASENFEGHCDDIEMSGEQVSGVIAYGVQDGETYYKRRFAFPNIRIQPNDTHGTYQTESSESPISFAEKEIFERVEWDGVLSVYAHAGELKVIRRFFPSATLPVFYERVELYNGGTCALAPEWAMCRRLQSKLACEGYVYFDCICAMPCRSIAAGESVVLLFGYSARFANKEIPQESDPLSKRRMRAEELMSQCDVTTGNEIVDTMFAFAKLRAGESLFRTEKGLIHCPGGMAFYAAIWCNDQCEYVAPWFAFTGDGLQAKAIENVFGWYDPYFNDEYRPIPSSIIGCGRDYWCGAGDRGDTGMYLYGLTRVLLTQGKQPNVKQQKALRWCVEYIRRNITEEGVVFSDSDELEDRISSGINLSTSALAYGGLANYAILLKRMQKGDAARKITQMQTALGEQKKIEQAALSSKKRKFIGIVICLYSGLRIGELLALTWSDIDFTKGTLAVNKTCHDGRDEKGNLCRIIDLPKTTSSKRMIPLPKQLLPVLKEYKRKSISEYVVESEKGEPPTVRSYQRTFELLQKRLHIERKGFHSLRHTFATRALECGMDVKTLAEILGHKNATVTLNRYAHSLMEHKQDMMNKLGKIFN